MEGKGEEHGRSITRGKGKAAPKRKEIIEREGKRGKCT